MYPGSEDGGVLTAKQALPVMKLNYGGSFSRISSINYTLGPLICSGESNTVFSSLLLLLVSTIIMLNYEGKSRPYPSEKEKVARDEMQSKIEEMRASIEELKNAPKAVIAFRATCAKNFPNSYSTRKDENPGNNLSKFEMFKEKYIIICFSYLEGSGI